jgi:hypothetical protein
MDVKYNPDSKSLQIMGNIKHIWELELLQDFFRQIRDNLEPPYRLETGRKARENPPLCHCSPEKYKEIGEYRMIFGPLNGIGFIIFECEECGHIYAKCDFMS